MTSSVHFSLLFKPEETSHTFLCCIIMAFFGLGVPFKDSSVTVLDKLRTQEEPDIDDEIALTLF